MSPDQEPTEYYRHPDLVGQYANEADERAELIERDLVRLLAAHVSTRPIAFVSTAELDNTTLAAILFGHPHLLKPLITICNVARRAIEQDLGFKNLDTYRPRLTEADCLAIAEYIRPLLPEEFSVDAMVRLDRFWYIDKEMRASKGRWEKSIASALNTVARDPFKKRKISVEGQAFEIDCASPTKGPIKFAIDVKRIGAPRDIHKRSDEIVNKATHFKRDCPDGAFGSVIYYAFSDKDNIVDRMKGTGVDAVVFAGDDSASILRAVRELVDRLDIPTIDTPTLPSE